ncbi:hypothetical protein [Streptomyces nitrosporeus]|uniref:hypothetical protein n=1 Tax=Streptomyces nitrosporeus TaxID=28894 RepID=UPI0039A396FF
MAVTTGCGLIGPDEEKTPAKASPSPLLPFTKETVADEIAAYTFAAGLPDGDTSAAGMPEGAWRECVTPWHGTVPADRAAEGFEGTVKRLRQHDWEIVSRHAEGDVSFRTFAKRGWKLYARHQALGDNTQAVAFTGVEDGCELPEGLKDEVLDPA